MSVTLNLFVSSPGDLPEERQAVAEVVGELAERPHFRRHCSLRAHLYEEVVPPVLAESPQAAISAFMIDPADCDVLVCLLGDRMGTAIRPSRKISKAYRSGTEFELEAACQSTRKPKPFVLTYYRKEPKPPYEAAQRKRVEDFLAEFKRSDSPYKGIEPKAFHDFRDLREQLLKDLENVLGQALELHARRRLWVRLGAGAVVCAVLLLGFALAHFLEAVPLASHQAQAVAQAVLDTAAADDPWSKVRDLHQRGCPAAHPLLEWLAKLEKAPFKQSEAIILALANLARGAFKEQCGCPELLSVLQLDRLSGAKYCRATHRRVLEALKDTSCPEQERFVCSYSKMVGTEQFWDSLCSAERRVDNVDDLKKASRDVLTSPCPL